MSSYHVNMDLAFFLARPMFNHQISLKFEDLRREDKTGWKSKTDAEKQVRHLLLIFLNNLHYNVILIS